MHAARTRRHKKVEHEMLCTTETRTSLLLGTILVAGILFAPKAFAHGGAGYNGESVSHHRYVYDERSSHKARIIHASYGPRSQRDSVEMNREHRDADAGARLLTEQLNLIQVPAGRQRAAELAEWQLQHGGGG